MKVLVVDDEFFNRYFITESLKKIENVIFEEASNGVEAIKKCEENSFDFSLIFMDINMPHMDGYEATKKIKQLAKEINKNIKIVAVTCVSYSSKIEEAGFDEFIPKPLKLLRLRQLLDNTIT